jgi:hypothetical protein
MATAIDTALDRATPAPTSGGTPQPHTQLRDAGTPHALHQGTADAERTAGRRMERRRPRETAMHRPTQDRPTTTARVRTTRHLGAATVALALGGLLTGEVGTAHAGGLLEDPCFATCGQYKWFLRKAPEVRDAGACCMPLIRKAKQKEERALDLYEAARDPSNTSAEASDLVREANRMIGARGRLIRRFIDCVNGVTRAFGALKRGDDPTADYATACGVALTCESDAGLEQ